MMYMENEKPSSFIMIIMGLSLAQRSIIMSNSSIAQYIIKGRICKLSWRMQAANALKNKRLRDQKKKVPFTKPDLSKVTEENKGRSQIMRNQEALCSEDKIASLLNNLRLSHNSILTRPCHWMSNNSII